MIALCKYPGGKRKLAPKLLPLIPEHRCYVELFCGAAGLLFNKPRSEGEIVNDINSELANAFRCMRFHGSTVIEGLRFRCNSREDFSRSRRCSSCEHNSMTDIQRAAEFLFRHALSFGGEGLYFGVQKKQGGGAATSLAQVRRDLEKVRVRLDAVVIENLDWARCLKLYDGPETFFFCDPPYIGGTQKAYKSWNIEQLAGLVAALRAAKGKWLLTINDRAEVRRLLHGLRLRRINRARGLSQINGGARYLELAVTPKNQ